jgi:hypothetical protein
MDEVLPPGWAIYKVHFPQPILYTFHHATLMGLGWAVDFDRKYGNYESNKRSVITKCDSLIIYSRQSEPVRVNQANCLSISGSIAWQILWLHGMSKANKSIETDDLKLFFDNHNGVLDQAEGYIERIGEQMMQHYRQRLVGRRPH